MSFFPNSDSPTFYNGTFVAAKKVVNVKNYYGSPRQQQDAKESGAYGCGVGNDANRFRTVLEGDLVLLREVASDNFDFKERSELLAKLKTTNPFRVRLEKRGAVIRVTRKVHTAEIVGFEPRKFTVVTFDTTGEGGVNGQPNENAVSLLPLFALFGRYTNLLRVRYGGEHTTSLHLKG
ncbi:hypothetical protein AAF712_007450 [Marasmius tenuissimus]|uniref:Uncharacterized protein n=1 Tax=Marasmius tenuissimus TaxID=585030 RepID=A0ABR2ZWK1_9AGAR